MRTVYNRIKSIQIHFSMLLVVDIKNKEIRLLSDPRIVLFSSLGDLIHLKMTTPLS